MVRVKVRYFLVELWSEQYRNRIKLPLREIELKQAILDSVEVLHGDYGLACIQAGFAIKMYNPATRMFIARVNVKFHSILATSLPFVTSVASVQLSLRTLKVSGTIRGCFKFLIQYDRVKVREIVQTLQLSSEKEQDITDLIERCHKRLSRRRVVVR